MRIDKISFITLDLQLDKPYTIAYETIGSATNYILKITTSEGISGFGCAAPDLAVTGESPAMVKDAIEQVVIPYLEGKNAFLRGALLEYFIEKLPTYKSTLAMIDLALLDVQARHSRMPLFQMLGGYRTSIATSVTIGILPLEETLEEARKILDQGYFILKIKGGLDMNVDIERIAKIRAEFGPNIRMRFDANQGYDARQTIDFIDQIYPYDVEIIEQPMPVGDELPKNILYQIPIMADESLKHLKDAFRIAKSSTIDMINIKIQKVGGLDQAMHINSVAKAANNEVMVGCLDECALGISSGLHFALSRPNVQYADLDAHLDFINDPFKGLFEIKDGIMYPSDAPGLGEINPEVEELFL
jgi:L-alanine-DL-glutamate epimerase-like enolase superfamily enzyme